MSKSEEFLEDCLLINKPPIHMYIYMDCLYHLGGFQHTWRCDGRCQHVELYPRCGQLDIHGLTSSSWQIIGIFISDQKKHNGLEKTMQLPCLRSAWSPLLLDTIYIGSFLRGNQKCIRHGYMPVEGPFITDHCLLAARLPSSESG